MILLKLRKMQVDVKIEMQVASEFEALVKVEVDNWG